MLGKLITKNARQRDAIHVAIAPVEALEDLQPGQHVGLGKTYFEATSMTDELIGIVDPFLTEEVKEGEWFYLLLYSETVTSLRHFWSHPAFKSIAKGVGE